MKKSQASIPDISWTFRRPELNAALEREAGWGSPICLPSSLPVWGWECWANCPHTVFLMTLLLLHIKTECLELKHLCNRNESSNNPKSKCYSPSKDESQNTKLDLRDKKHFIFIDVCSCTHMNMCRYACVHVKKKEKDKEKDRGREEREDGLWAMEMKPAGLQRLPAL